MIKKPIISNSIKKKKKKLCYYENDLLGKPTKAIIGNLGNNNAGFDWPK